MQPINHQKTTAYVALGKGEELRAQAESCRYLAQLALTTKNKQFWLRLAEEWLGLAAMADPATVRSERSGGATVRYESKRDLLERPPNVRR
jgi:hypothetical protein